MKTQTLQRIPAPRPRMPDEGRLAQAWLLAYLASVVGVTFVHEPAWLAAALAMAVAAAGTSRWRLLRRTVLAVLAFNLAVSAGYVLVAWWQGGYSGRYLLMINLRVVLLVFLGFWFISRVNVLRALAFSRTLAFVATLAVGQIGTFKRIIRNFRLAFVSRNPVRASLASRGRHAAAQAGHLLDKSVCGAADTAMAMRSRGCFDD